MSAENLERPIITDFEHAAALGRVAIPQQEQITVDEPGPILGELPTQLAAEQAGARKIGVAATLIKERFQTLDKKLTADERHAEREKLRESSVRILFKTFGMLDNTAEVDAPFAVVYRQIEDGIDTIDRERLADLSEIYESHPAIKVFDTLKLVSTIPSDDIVFMRRASLVMMDEHTA